ncbi:ABC transporter ATP-binding protein [Candidatus Pacearchaeota archaeon]|nr:ABC transporter ATP-binding protein [Candidatus Pacearchaeota archaeon]OHD34006.1 MAG: ABC transporter ATP-binding protein [Spirochaetes bacterium GWD1_27_9]
MKNKKGDSFLIELKDVFKHYYMGENVVKAVDGISLKINQGEFVAIMGPSGSGKSTSMNLVGSLDVPTKGHIFLDGEDISTFSESDLAQLRGQKIGFIFQSFNLIPNLTAKENVMIPMTFQGISLEERELKAEELLELVELGDRINHYPNELSGGQKQRVAIARSLANNPEVILADEPTGNLDTKTGDIVMHFLDKLHREGKTIIMITHEPELAEHHAEVIYWLRDGKLEKITKKKKGKKYVDGEFKKMAPKWK